MAWHSYSRTYLHGTTCLAFDPQADLLWTGNLAGYVSSHYTKPDYNFSRYTAYRGHIPGPTKDIVVDDRGVLSVGGSLKLANRRGIALWNIQSVVYTAGTADIDRLTNVMPLCIWSPLVQTFATCIRRWHPAVLQ